MTAQNIKDALYIKYNDPMHYIAIAEFRPGTGYGINADRFIDFYVIDCYSGCGATAFEIKVSRSDFLLELKKPEKRRLSLHFSNQFFFVAPKGIIKPNELPPECGLVEATEDTSGITTKETRPALHRDTARPTWRFVAAISRTLRRSCAEQYTAERQTMQGNESKLIRALQSCYGDIDRLNQAMLRENIAFQTPPHIEGNTLDPTHDIKIIRRA